jgi:RecB family exonuclease
MPINRVFLNWNRPGLVAAVDYVVGRFATPGELDLAGVVVAMPGGRAGRRLLEMLVERADQQDRVLTPPQIVTAGHLPELFYEARKPFVNELSQHLAWVAALKAGKPEQLQELIPAPPAENDLVGWLALAEMIARLHRELAADALDFSAVADHGSHIDGFREELRWQAIAVFQQEYLRVLDRLDLWDLQTARLYAIRQKECRTESQIILVGTVDLNRSQRMMLDQVADHVTALVLAPPELANHFDNHGCLRPEAWLDIPIPLTTEQIDIVGDQADQAEAVVLAIAAMEGQYSADQIVIGVPDEEIVPYVEQHLRQCKIAARYGAGRPLASTLPSRLLAVVADYVEVPSFSSFAAMVRHPSVQSWLEIKGIAGDCLNQLDVYYSEHLPYVLGDEWLGDERAYGTIRRVHEALHRLLGHLSDPRQALDEWGKSIVAILIEVFGQVALDPSVEADGTILAACDKIHEVLRELSSVPKGLMPAVSGADAVRMVLDQLVGITIPPTPDRSAVEMLGWLELPLDDAPALVVTSLNEGWVPSSLNGDLFLPNQLRRALGIEDNDRRYARDAYALATLVASRRFLKVIAGRRSAEGDPRMPSRLLFACDEETIARRVMAFCSQAEASNGKPVSLDILRPGQQKSCFEVPKPGTIEPITSMRVTEFKDYLACPYRYYLRHCLKLEAVRDVAEELDGGAFGTLAHQVLGEFGKSAVAASADAEGIQRYLDEELDRQVQQTYGHAPLSAIRVQVEQLRLRLREFANWQAAWAAQGWEIKYVEKSPEEGKAKIDVDGQGTKLRGRIDRIDFHPATGKWMIIDYKSSDTPSTPEKAHRSNDEWIDLQLPLYRHLAAGMGINGSPQLAYVVLPKDTSKIDILVAEWTEEELKSADDVAAEVIRNVRAKKFWPPAESPPDFSEDFAPICQDGQFRTVLVAEAEEGETES